MDDTNGSDLHCVPHEFSTTNIERMFYRRLESETYVGLICSQNQISRKNLRNLQNLRVGANSASPEHFQIRILYTNITASRIFHEQGFSI